MSLVSQIGGNPGKPHLDAVKCILCYLQGTAHFTLMLGQREHESVVLIDWTDSDWAQDPDTHCSIGEFVFNIAGSIISLLSKKQPMVALSTVKAEYMAGSNITKEAI